MTIVDEALEELNEGIEGAKRSMLNALGKLGLDAQMFQSRRCTGRLLRLPDAPEPVCAAFSARALMLSVKPREYTSLGQSRKRSLLLART